MAGNDICGNFSAEYGGGLSAYGLSPNGKIHDNRIYLNRSYDEGGGVMIAGALAVDPTANYGTTNGAKGSGPVDIYNNVIQANLGDDDGGGIRFLMAGNFPMNVYNNMIVNNVSTHEGGGVALDDAPNVRFLNNTVMKNITTATAVTSNGQPAPAGLSTGQNSAQLQATLPAGSPAFSNPLLFNDIFWDNRAGARGTNTVTGIGAAGDASPINRWDMGVNGAGSARTDELDHPAECGHLPVHVQPHEQLGRPRGRPGDRHPAVLHLLAHEHQLHRRHHGDGGPASQPAERLPPARPLRRPAVSERPTRPCRPTSSRPRRRRTRRRERRP